jgi:hypothetical protein
MNWRWERNVVRAWRELKILIAGLFAMLKMRRAGWGACHATQEVWLHLLAFCIV